MSKKYKKITFICMNLACGGTEKVVTNLAYYYSKKNISTSIITLEAAIYSVDLKSQTKLKLLNLIKNIHHSYLADFKYHLLNL